MSWDTGKHAGAVIEPESAEFLALLVLAKQAKSLLEIGTSGGYSTLWQADAVEQTGGHLITLEIETQCQQTALKHLVATGLSEVTTALCVDAGKFLQSNQVATILFCWMLSAPLILCIGHI
ncbi:O-methyltransferase [Necropsobacter rosorum]|uniref:O-methyltransferase n=1 Tax=Necropsobacter rosorum TaxID=908285 RepID=UPI003C7DF568